MNIHLKTDVCMTHYKLDPCHYFTTPGLSWNSMLRITKVELELFTDISMHLLCQKGIRGGLTQVGKRHSVTNNKYLEGFDPTKPSEYITYIDANNL